jgi:hypothetical protein
MTNTQRTLRQLIKDGMYVVDETVVANAILARANVKATVANTEFRSHVKPSPVRSFRRDPGARSFRLARHAGQHHH